MPKMRIQLTVSLIAVIGLSVFSAKAQPELDNPTVLNFKLTGLMPATNSPIVKEKETSTGSTITTKYIAIKVKITNKEILTLLAAEAAISFPSGAKLVGFDGEISVSDKTGTNILYSPDFTFDSESESVGIGTETESYSETETKYTENYSGSGTETMIGSISFYSKPNYFSVSGLVKGTDSYNDSYVSTESADTYKGKYKYSFTATLAGGGYIDPAGGDGIISGTVTGTESGKYSYNSD